MKLSEIYSTDKTIISFEVFPPKSEPESLLREINKLKKYNPAFISLTYGAGGNQNKSIDLLKDLKNTGFNVMPHFTCITSDKQKIENDIKNFEAEGIKNILALRGDIPEDKTFVCNDFCFANELVTFIKDKTNIDVGVAGYPEGHIECPDLKTDIENLKKKVDAGADAIFTQLFFVNDFFFDYVDRVRNAGITIPVIPGIMHVINKKQIDKIVSMANISVPEKLQKGLEKYKEKDLIEFGIEYAIEQCKDLIKKGAKGLHFFTLNKAYSVSKILDNIKGKI